MKTTNLLAKKIAEAREALDELIQMQIELSGDANEAPSVVTMEELLGETFTWDWIIGGLIGTRTIGMLVADPHVGKSTLAIQLCIALAAGKKWLGWSPSKAYSVLYAFAEGARPLVASRIKTCAQSERIDLSPTGFVQAACFQDFDVTSPNFRQLIARSKPEFCVLDALGYFFKGDENSSVEWKQKMVIPLRSLSDEFGTTFMVIHHQVKENQFRKGWQKGRGTSAMFADVDYYWRLEGIEGDDGSGRKLFIDKNKYGQSGHSINLVFDKMGARFTPGPL